jgi:hypothetical protein
MAGELLEPTKSTRMFHETVGMAAGQTEFTCKSGLALSCSLGVEKTLAVAACRDTTENSQGISNGLPLTLHQFLWWTQKMANRCSWWRLNPAPHQTIGGKNAKCGGSVVVNWTNNLQLDPTNSSSIRILRLHSTLADMRLKFSPGFVRRSAPRGNNLDLLAEHIAIMQTPSRDARPHACGYCSPSLIIAFTILARDCRASARLRVY